MINSEFNIRTTNRPALLCMLPPENEQRAEGPFSPLIEITEWVGGDAGADIAYCNEFGAVNILPLGEKAIEGLLSTLLLRRMIAQGQAPSLPGAGNPVPPPAEDLDEREPTDAELQAIEREEAARDDGEDDYEDWNNEAPVVNGTYGMSVAEIEKKYPKCPNCGKWHDWEGGQYPAPPESPPVTRAGSPPPFVE